MKLLKDYFDKQKRKSIIEKMEALGEELFQKYGYRKDDKVDADFLFDMLSKGYIDESYPLYIAEVYEGALSVNGLRFLNAVNSGENIGFDYKLKQRDCEQLCDRITAWDSVGVLNNDFARYIVERENLRETYFPMVLTQIYENDKIEKSEKFFDQFWNNSKFDANREIGIFEQIGKKVHLLKPLDFLNVFFNNHNVVRFKQFFDYFSKSDSTDKDYLKTLFEDDKDFYSKFIICFEDELESINATLKQIEIQVDLTKDIVQQLPVELLLKFTEFPVTKENYDLLLLKENRSTEPLGYMTRCIEMNGDKSIFDDSRISDFCKNILMNFDNVEESVATEERIFKVSEKKLMLEEKTKLFKKTLRSWKDILTFYRGVGWDEAVFDAVTNVVFANSIRTKEKKDDEFLSGYVLLGKNFAGFGYKRDFEKLLCDILQSQLVSSWDHIVLGYTLEVWAKYSSVIGSLKIMKSIDDMNHVVIPDVMRFVFSREIKYLDKDLLLEFYKYDEESFIDCCQLQRLSSFRLLVLKIRDDSRLRRAQKIILESTSSLPEKNDIDFKIYKDAALVYTPLGERNEELRFNVCKQCVMYINDVISVIKDIVDNDSQSSYSFGLSKLHSSLIRACDGFDSFLRDSNVMQDIWLALLVKSAQNKMKVEKNRYISNLSAKMLIEWLEKLRIEFEGYRRYYI